MSLRCLSITDFRNLTGVNIEPSSRLNVFCGPNGSGKTSLLEAIHCLSVARSFRSRKHKTVIHHEKEGFVVFGRVEDPLSQVENAIGVQRTKSGSSDLIRVNQKTVSSASSLALLFPVCVVNADTLSALSAPPSARRALLDWLVFHVEHTFFSLWKQYESCIKQRNSLLRHDKIDHRQLDAWDDELVPLAESISKMRADCFVLYKQEFDRLMSTVADIPGLIKLSLNAGWDRSEGFACYLKDSRVRDSVLGYTRQGPHRADIRVTIEGRLAAEVLSRGQQKIVMCALLLAQGMVFNRQTGKQPTYLVDDLPSELDETFRAQLCGWLNDLSCQVFVTGVFPEEITRSWPKGCPREVFHVKHGVVEQLKNDY